MRFYADIAEPNSALNILWKVSLSPPSIRSSGATRRPWCPDSVPAKMLYGKESLPGGETLFRRAAHRIVSVRLQNFSDI